ncbi:hypothetical protein MTO96_047413 [Rhipicephalus appendiculatus]
MTRHARNCTAGAVYTYHEKQKDTQTCGYGTQRMRLGKDAVKDFDCCCLSLQPCRNPVITPEGYLYDKECILEYIIKQKAENARLLKEYEAEQKREAKELQELALAEERSKAESFVCKERTIVSCSASTSSSVGASVSNMVNGKDAQLPSFWVPCLTPSAKKDKAVKPARYMCAVTHDILGNSVPVAALRTSGNVVTMECVEKLLKKDWIDPTNSKPLKESDIIPLQRGGTGYSSTNLTLDAKVKKPVMTV